MGRGQELLDAAREGDRRTVEKIVGQITKRSGPFTSLRRGAGVNVQDDNGYTPLHHACLNGHREIVHVLLSTGAASPCIADKKGATPLHLAAFNGCSDVVRMLLAYNNPPVNIDQLTLMHETALMIAAQFGHTDVVAQLITHGADVTIKNIKDESALDLAAQYGRLETVRHLVKFKPELVDVYRTPLRDGFIFTSTPLHRASKYGKKDVVKELLKAGIDPNIRTDNGTPLHEAGCFARASVVRLLLKRGADLKARDRRGKTVQDLLAERPEEETRHVREVIRDFIRERSMYESEEDLPPFPVHDNSPTAPMSNPPSRSLHLTKSASNTNTDSLSVSSDSIVTNSSSSERLSPSQPHNKSHDIMGIVLSELETKLSNCKLQTSKKSIGSNSELETKIINSKLSTSKKSIGSNSEPETQLSNTKLSTSKKSIGSNSELETKLSNSKLNTSPQVPKKSLGSTSAAKLELPQWESTRHSSLDNEYRVKNNLRKVQSFKVKPPSTLPKPKKPLVEYVDENIYANTPILRLEQSLRKPAFGSDSDCNEITENIYGNVVDIPSADCIDSTYCDMTGINTNTPSNPIEGSYLDVNPLEKENSEDSIYVDPFAVQPIYTHMDGERKRNSITHSSSLEKCDKTSSNSQPKSKAKINSIPDDGNLVNMHIRGVRGCEFETPESEYIYELNRNTERGSVFPFIRIKEKAVATPCYCRNIDDNETRETNDNNDIFYSCENLDDENGTQSNNTTEYLQKFTDIKMDTEAKDPMTAPETQKISNKNESLNPPSSLIKNHPQSFVKKLASKCLGLKAKFNSAPNISNGNGTDPEVDITTKGMNLKPHANTLLIGNSKFFKRLSKKEEAGEIVCNDEFDTISLDRVATLNRDSVVNRSNRSCPGFKTSLPNISENNELSDDSESLVITELDCDKNKSNVQSINEAVNLNPVLDIFEPRERMSIISNTSASSTNLVNECYESFEFYNTSDSKTSNSVPRPIQRPQVPNRVNKENFIYENVNSLRKPTPAARTHIPVKLPLDEVEKKVLYENVAILQEKKPDPPKRTIMPMLKADSLEKQSSPSVSRTSTLSSDSLIDETNLEDILLSEKSKSFRHSKSSSFYSGSYKSDVYRTQSIVSDASDITEASAIENVDCSDDADVDTKGIYLSMTGTLPNNKTNSKENKKVLFRHKTFTNIEADRSSVKVKDFPRWDSEFIKETLPHYHIRGTGHCIYQAPTVQEFIYVFNRNTLYKDVPPFIKIPNDKRDSYFETTICFCKPRPPKHHNSAEDLLERMPKSDEENVTIDFEDLQNRREITAASFTCFCDSGTCKLHSNRREAANDYVVKFSAIKKSISTPDITLDSSPSSTVLKRLTRNNSVPKKLENPYAVISVDEIINRTKDNIKPGDGDIYTTMSHPSSTLSSSASRLYSVKDISEVMSLSNQSTSTASTLTNASDMHLPVRKSSSSEYSGHWSLQSCNSNVTIKSDLSYKTCLEESSDDSDDGTLHTDDESEAETVKSDVSTGKRPWVHSDSFRFGSNTKAEIETITEETQSSFEDSKFESMSSKFESGISVEGSESSSSGGEDDSGIPRSGRDMSLNCASLERGSVGGVRSGSGRRRWDEAEGTSEGDALSISSAASSCAPLHLVHHHDYSKVSPTPPKKPPRRNLSVSPTHANSPSSGYSYELRVHARSQDDLDDIQSAKHYLKHGRSVDHYVDSKLSYSEYEENHNSPRVIPIPNPRPSLKQRPQPVAITAMYENVVIKEQNPRRKLRRNLAPSNDYDRMNDRRKYSTQERSSLESLLDDQSMNSPSDCERFYDGSRVDIPLSPTHYEQPPTPEHPPPSAKQAENSIHERIRPLSQEYKRRSMLRDSQTETEVNLLRAASAASVASGATDRSGNTDNCVEEYVCDVPFAGLFKGSTTTLDGIGLRPMPAERPKTLRKLKSVYDSSPTETHNGQTNGVEDEVRRRSNTTSSNQSGEKSLSILSPFDEQEEWAKISEIMASFGSKLVRESVFVSELEQEFTSRLGLSCSESSLSPSVASNLGLWLSGLGLHDYETLFLESGYDDIEFVNGVLDENDLREMGIEENDRQKILESAKQLPLKITEISNNHNNNNISNKNQNESVDEWLRQINLEQYSDTFRKHLYVDMDRVRRIWEVELTAVLEIQKAGHRKRILASVSGEHNGPINHMEDINTDLNTLKNNIQQLKEEIKEKLPHSENLKPVPPPVVPTLAPPGGETLKRSKKNRPAPQPPRPSDLEIRAPSELLVGVPGALKTQWKHQPFVLVTGAVTYVANYLGSTVVKELRGTESTKKSIQKLKKSTKEPRDSPDIILSISYRGVKFLNTITKELICEHEIRNIHCACQDADDLTHFAYITKDHATKSHYCHVFRVATMDQATEVILTLGEAFEVAYQMALREQSNRTKVTQSIAKTPTHDPMTATNKEKPNLNHGRSHSITEIKLNGHQLKIAPLPASLSNEDFQAAARNADGSKSPRTPLLKAPMASTEEL